MKTSDLKYLMGYSIPFVALISLLNSGWISYSTAIFAFIAVPLIEFLLPVNSSNLSEEDEKNKAKSIVFDILLYLNVPIQLGLLFLFLTKVSTAENSTFDIIGYVLTMGICNGVLGINVAHELGHRVTKTEQFLAKLLLMTSLYVHFNIEHNRGHHKNVATPADPATASLNQTIYSFFIQSIIGSFKSAWRIQRSLLKKENKAVLSLANELLLFLLLEAALVLSIYIIFGLQTMLFFLASALIGVLLLETINYIEHYGLVRKLNERGVYEKVDVIHSWNADQTLGRIMLYELTRHSDHHYKASRKYQILRRLDKSPQLPAGYPAMMLLSFVPVLFFKIMNKRIPS